MNKFLRILAAAFITGILLSPAIVQACIWDADTLDNEKKEQPKIAEIIFGTGKETKDASLLHKRIEELKANPRSDDVAWWNDLAGAYLRLGQPLEAANLLESGVEQFDSNYGIHANLGTAYHLLGRYQDAEKEIARDLEINPDAHFGLEKYHLALLQYLSRDDEYQKQHVYVDEWTEEFFNNPAGYLDDTQNTNFVEGVLYMASLNPKEPACFTMLGIVCLTKRDFNLAAAAFEKAIALDSPQKEILQKKLNETKEFIRQSHQQGSSAKTSAGFGVFIVVAILVGGFLFLNRIVFRN